MNKLPNMLIIVAAFMFALPNFAFAQVTFNDVQTNQAISVSGNTAVGSGSPAGAPVGDFFAAINAFDAQMAQQSASSNNNSTNTGSVANSYNPLALNNYNPNSNSNNNTSPSSNTTQLVTNDTEDEDVKLALAGSATKASGEYGEVVKFNNNNPQYFQASAIAAQRSNSALNSGAILFVLLLVLVVMFVARRFYKRKPQRYPQSAMYQDSFHDMSRYHGQRYPVARG